MYEYRILIGYISSYRCGRSPVTGLSYPCNTPWSPWCSEAWSSPHFLDNLVTGGGEVVGLTHRPPFTPQEDSWYSFLSKAGSSPGP
jgi:hypothetical protein